MTRKIYNQLYISNPQSDKIDEFLINSDCRVDLNKIFAEPYPQQVTVLHKPFTVDELKDDNFELQYYEGIDEWRKEVWGTSGVVDAGHYSTLPSGSGYCELVTIDEPPRKWFNELCFKLVEEDIKINTTINHLCEHLYHHHNASLIFAGSVLKGLMQEQLQEHCIALNYFDEENEWAGQLLFNPLEQNGGGRLYKEYQRPYPSDENYEHFIDGHEFADHLFDEGE